MAEGTTILVSPGDKCELCLVFNQDSEAWTNYVIGYLNEDQFQTRIYKIEDRDLFISPNSAHVVSVASAKAFLVFITPGHLDLLTNNPEANYSRYVKDPYASGVLFFLGVDSDDVRNEGLEDRFVNYGAWNGFDSHKHRELVLKIVEIIEKSSILLEADPPPVAPPVRPARSLVSVGSSNVDSPPASLTGEKKKKRSRPGYDKVNLCNFQVLPYEVKCEEPTPVVVSFSAPLPSDDVEILLEGQNSSNDMIKVTAKRLNPHTLYFEAPEHVEGEVNMRIMMGGNCTGSEKLIYKSSSDYVLGIHSLYLHLLNQVMSLAVKHGVEPFQLEEASQDLFNDTSNLPAQVFEDFFRCYEFVLTENSKFEIPTLLHLAAKFGMKRFATTVIDLPGASYAHSITNSDTQYPEDVARNHDFDDLSDTFTAARDMAATFDSIYSKMMAPYINVKGEGAATAARSCAPPSSTPGYSVVPPNPHSVMEDEDETYLDMSQSNLSATVKRNTSLPGTRFKPLPLEPRSGNHGNPGNHGNQAPPRVPGRLPRNNPESCSLGEGDGLLCIDGPPGYSPRRSRSLGVLDLVDGRRLSPRRRRDSGSSTDSSEGYEKIQDTLEEYSARKPPPVPREKPALQERNRARGTEGSDTELPPRPPSRPGTPARFRSPTPRSGSPRPGTPRAGSPSQPPRSQSPDVGKEAPPPVPERNIPTIETDEYYTEVQSAPYSSAKESFNWVRSISEETAYVGRKRLIAEREASPVSMGTSATLPTNLSDQILHEESELLLPPPAAGDGSSAAMQSKSQQELIDILTMVKEREINQSEAEMMFEEWKTTFNKGKTGSFKERQLLLQKLADGIGTEEEPHYADNTRHTSKKPSFFTRIKNSIKPGTRGPSVPKQAAGVSTKSTGIQPITITEDDQYLALGEDAEPSQRASTVSNGSSGSRGSTLSQDSGTDSMSSVPLGDEVFGTTRRNKDPPGERPKSMRVKLLENRMDSIDEPPPMLPPRGRARSPPPIPGPHPVEEEEEDMYTTDDFPQEPEAPRRPLPPPPAPSDRDTQLPLEEDSDEYEDPSPIAHAQRQLPPPPPPEFIAPSSVCPPGGRGAGSSSTMGGRPPAPAPIPRERKPSREPSFEEPGEAAPVNPLLAELAKKGGREGLRKTSSTSTPPHSPKKIVNEPQPELSEILTHKLKPRKPPGPPTASKPKATGGAPSALQGDDSTSGASPWGPKVKAKRPPPATKPKPN